MGTEITWQNLATRLTSSGALTHDCTPEKFYANLMPRSHLKSVTAEFLGVGPMQTYFSKPIGQLQCAAKFENQ